jgi:hypothetical protein
MMRGILEKSGSCGAEKNILSLHGINSFIVQPAA